MKKIGIIGTGLSGITAAFYLKDYFQVYLFDKSRGVGGRIATRRSETCEFDHGAPFFSATSDAFNQFLQPLMKSKHVSPWTMKSIQLETQKIQQENVFVGTPSMNHMMKYFKRHLNIKTHVAISKIKRENEKWHFFDDKNQHMGDFDWVISTAPAEQTKAIIPPHISFYNHLKSYSMHGNVVTMVQANNIQHFNFDVAYSAHKRIKKIIVNSAKPHRKNITSLVIHANDSYSTDIINQISSIDPTHVPKDLDQLIGLNPNHINHIQSHTWRYARTVKKQDTRCLLDQSERIGVCGDWLIESEVEKAYDSGYTLAMKILEGS